MKELRYKLKTAATFDTDLLAALKRNLHIGTEDEEDTSQDEYLQEILDAVVDDVQSDIGRRLCRETWYGYLDDFPSVKADGNCEVEISLGPVNSVVGVQYYNSSDVKTLMSTDDWLLDNVEMTARLRFLNTYNVYSERLNGVEVEFTNGYASAAAIPKNIKDAIILLATDRYLNPENPVREKISAAERLLRKYRVQRY